MFTIIRQYVFSLYEQRMVRNWFYTLAFGVFVPVGCRFAFLAWEFGGDFDRVMTVIAGLLVGITTVVTLMRIWAVPPSRTLVPSTLGEESGLDQDPKPDSSEIMAALRAYSARNRQLAVGARALGTPRHHHL